MQAITSLHTNHCPPVSHVMDHDMEHMTTTTLPAPTNTDPSMTTNNHRPATPELSALIAELKHDIATIVLESQAMFQQQATLKSPINQKYASVT